MVFPEEKQGGEETIVRAVERALGIIELLCSSKNGRGVREIAREMEMSPSSACKYLQVLADGGFVYKDERTHGYRMTYKIVDWSSILLRNNETRELAHPLLTLLMEETGMTTHLAMKQGNIGIYLDKIESEKTIPTRSRIGMETELYSTAFGKAILAFVSEDELLRYLAETEFKKKTQRTNTSKDTFVEQLELVRARGYAEDNEENESGIRCLGAPVFGFAGRVVGGISVTFPVSMIRSGGEHNVIAALKRTAFEISARLGCNSERMAVLFDRTASS